MHEEILSMSRKLRLQILASVSLLSLAFSKNYTSFNCGRQIGGLKIVVLNITWLFCGFGK